MLTTGLKAQSTIQVDQAHTALAVGSGDMPVLATPAMMALMENAAMNAVANELPEGSTTVGSSISSTHVKPTPLGGSATATATLIAVDGRKLTFKVESHDAEGLIGEGEHVRYIVDRARFLAKLGL